MFGKTGRSTGQLAREIARTVLGGLAGWGVGVPLSCLVPKAPGQIVAIGSGPGRFTGNVKYLAAHALASPEPGTSLTLITEDHETLRQLEAAGVPCLLHPTFQSIRALLRATTVVVDSTEWASTLKYHLLWRSKKVQLWHGVGFKRIELQTLQTAHFLQQSWIRRQLLRAYWAIGGRFPHYDLVATTSPFYAREVFEPSFRADRVAALGYPRNDPLRSQPATPRQRELWRVGLDEACIEQIRARRAAGCKAILYAPTFRDTGRSPFERLDLERLARFCDDNEMTLVVKPHPADRAAREALARTDLLEYRAGDIYAALPEFDLLLTDYSSIYMDFLILDRPVVFLPLDLDRYQAEDRETQFDYDEMTPGPKCRDQDQLEATLRRILSDGRDDHAGDRERVRDLAFAHLDQAVAPAIWNLTTDRN